METLLVLHKYMKCWCSNRPAISQEVTANRWQIFSSHQNGKMQNLFIIISHMKCTYLLQITHYALGGTRLSADTIFMNLWYLSSQSTLVEAMVWCLMASSHCLNQYWLIIDLTVRIHFYFDQISSSLIKENTFENGMRKMLHVVLVSMY